MGFRTRCWVLAWLVSRALGTTIIEILEDVRLLVGRVVPDVFLHGLNLLDQVELILLCQLVQIELDLFLRDRCRLLLLSRRTVVWSVLLLH